MLLRNALLPISQTAFDLLKVNAFPTTVSVVRSHFAEYFPTASGRGSCCTSGLRLKVHSLGSTLIPPCAETASLLAFNQPMTWSVVLERCLSAVSFVELVCLKACKNKRRLGRSSIGGLVPVSVSSNQLAVRG